MSVIFGAFTVVSAKGGGGGVVLVAQLSARLMRPAVAKMVGLPKQNTSRICSGLRATGC